MRRRALLIAAVAPVVLAVTAVPTTAAPSGYDHQGETLNILPPGSRGNVSIPGLVKLGVTNLPGLLSNPGDPQGALATATPTNPPNFADQLEMYDAINRVNPGSLTDGQLTKYYKDARLGGELDRRRLHRAPRRGRDDQAGQVRRTAHRRGDRGGRLVWRRLRRH